MKRIDIVKATVVDKGLLIDFSNNTTRYLKMNLFKSKSFEALVNSDKLHNFKIVHGSIEWEDGLSISSDTAFIKSERV